MALIASAVAGHSRVLVLAGCAALRDGGHCVADAR